MGHRDTFFSCQMSTVTLRDTCRVLYISFLCCIFYNSDAPLYILLPVTPRHREPSLRCFKGSQAQKIKKTEEQHRQWMCVLQCEVVVKSDSIPPWASTWWQLQERTILDLIMFVWKQNEWNSLTYSHQPEADVFLSNMLQSAWGKHTTHSGSLNGVGQ